MIKLLTKIVQIRVYKWLINFYQIRCDSWTKAATEKNEGLTDEKKAITNKLWYDAYYYYTESIKRLTEKLENI